MSPGIRRSPVTSLEGCKLPSSFSVLSLNHSHLSILVFSKSPALTCTPESIPIFPFLMSDVFVHREKQAFFLIPFFVSPSPIPTNHIPIPMDSASLKLSWILWCAKEGSY